MFIHSVVKISSAHNKNLVSQLGSQTDLCACNRNVSYIMPSQEINGSRKMNLSVFFLIEYFYHSYFKMGIFFIPFEIKDTSLEPNMHNKAIYSILSHTGDKNYMQGYVLEALYHNCENHGPWVRVHTLERGQRCYIVKMY